MILDHCFNRVELLKYKSAECFTFVKTLTGEGARGRLRAFAYWEKTRLFLPLCLFSWGKLLIVVAWIISTTIWYLILKERKKRFNTKKMLPSETPLVVWHLWLLMLTKLGTGDTRPQDSSKQPKCMEHLADVRQCATCSSFLRLYSKSHSVLTESVTTCPMAANTFSGSC